MKISNRLDSLHLEEGREKADGECAAIDELTKRTNQLSPRAPTSVGDGEGKVRILTTAVMATPWGLSVLQKVPSEPSYQRLVNAICTSRQESVIYESENPQNKGTVEGARKSVWKQGSESKSKNKSDLDIFIGELLKFLMIERLPF